MSPSPLPRTLRDIRDDQEHGPEVLERLLMLLTVAMLVVLVTSTVCQAVLLFVLDVSARVRPH
jgi:hypothetical protein